MDVFRQYMFFTFYSKLVFMIERPFKKSSYQFRMPLCQQQPDLFPLGHNGWGRKQEWRVGSAEEDSFSLQVEWKFSGKKQQIQNP